MQSLYKYTIGFDFTMATQDVILFTASPHLKIINTAETRAPLFEGQTLLLLH